MKYVFFKGIFLLKKQIIIEHPFIRLASNFHKKRLFLSEIVVMSIEYFFILFLLHHMHRINTLRPNHIKQHIQENRRY